MQGRNLLGAVAVTFAGLMTIQASAADTKAEAVSVETKSVVVAKAEPATSVAATGPVDPVKERLANEVAKLEELDREWQQNQGKKLSKKSDDQKKDKDEKKDEKKAEKQKKMKSDSSASRGGSNHYESVRSGGVEIGGSTRASNSRSNSTGSYSSQSSYSSTSIGVHTTVVRLDGPSDN
jgi:hypothetical protein